MSNVWYKWDVCMIVYKYICMWLIRCFCCCLLRLQTSKTLATDLFPQQPSVDNRLVADVIQVAFVVYVAFEVCYASVQYCSSFLPRGM